MGNYTDEDWNDNPRNIWRRIANESSVDLSGGSQAFQVWKLLLEAKNAEALTRYTQHLRNATIALAVLTGVLIVVQIVSLCR